jgi:RNA polymerase sporulation-specific sigma factor
MKQKLIEDNMKLVYFLIHKYYPKYGQDEDLIQCGMVGLCKAADTWDETKSEFSTYASRCILNEIGMEFKRRNKHNGILSLDYEVTGKDGVKVSFGELLSGDDDVDYVGYEGFYNKLSPTDQEIVEYRRLGFTTEAIAQIIGCSRQNVEKHLRKLRAVWRNVNGD